MSTEKMNNDQSTTKMNDGTARMNAGTAKLSGNQGGKSTGELFTAGQTIILDDKNCVIEKMISSSSGEANVYKINIDGNPYALKHYKPDMPLSDTAKKVLTKIKNNPKNRIIEVFDFGRFNNQDYEIMEYAEGGTLDQFLKTHGGVNDTKKIKTIIKQINEGLQQLHDFYKVIYQDLKPENIYFKDAAKSSLVLADFGISSVMRPGNEEVEVVASITDLYAAPELAHKGNRKEVMATPSVDYFALGITMIELWLGEKPFKGIKATQRDYLIAEENVDLPIDMPSDYAELIQGLIKPQRKDRWGNEQVQKWLKGETLTQRVKKTSSASTTSTAYEPLKFSDKEYASNPKELAALMEKYPDVGKTCLYSDIIKNWLQKAGDVMLFNKAENIVSEYNKDKDAGLYTAIYTFDSGRPFKSRGGKICESGEDMADAIMAESAYYMEDLKKPNANLYLYLAATEGSEGKEAAQTFCSFFKEYTPKQALALIYLKLQQDGGITIGTKRYQSPDELKKEKNGAQIDLVKKAVMETDSTLLVWLSGIYGDDFESTDKFDNLSILEQFFLLGLFPFLSFKELTGSNGEAILKDFIDSYASRSDLFETYAAQGLPLAGPNCIDKKTPIDYIVGYFEYLSKKQSPDTLYNLMRLLCKLGADINECSDDGRYPLFTAFGMNNDDLVNLLLELGADRGKYDELVVQFAEKERIEAEQHAEKERQEQERIRQEQERLEKRIQELKKKREHNAKYSACISAGNDHTVGLKKDGTVVAVGYNNKLYDAPYSLPREIYCGQCDVSSWRNIVAVFAGDEHTVGLKADGTVVATGDNSLGQCNVSGWQAIVAISADSFNTVGLKKDGTVVVAGKFYKGECNGWRDIVAVSSDCSGKVGLKKDGTVVITAANRDKGWYDIGWSDIVAVFAAHSHTVGLKADGTVVAVGNNTYGECNVGSWRNIVAISAGGFSSSCSSLFTHYTVGLKADGTVVAVGEGNKGRCNVSEWRNIGRPLSREQIIRMQQGLCIHCGGQISGLFTKKCKDCGKVQ
ncbi:MAG: protein kinase [Treponema sp.]|jgi:serine/threonine protein kinase|nr:protein kinase [Treponema sp.]